MAAVRPALRFLLSSMKHGNAVLLMTGFESSGSLIKCVLITTGETSLSGPRPACQTIVDLRYNERRSRSFAGIHPLDHAFFHEGRDNCCSSKRAKRTR